MDSANKLGNVVKLVVLDSPLIIFRQIMFKAQTRFGDDDKLKWKTKDNSSEEQRREQLQNILQDLFHINKARDQVAPNVLHIMRPIPPSPLIPQT